jgi:ABC-type nitrate/sulfonate/bicarbonate transport system permease component
MTGMTTTPTRTDTRNTLRIRAVRARDDRPDNRRLRIALGTLAVLVAFGIWELLTVLKVQPRILLPNPADVVNAFKQIFSSPTVGADFAASGKEFLYGYVLAVVVGIVAGLLIGWYRPVGYVLDPFVNFAYAVPRVAVSPLLLVWLGIGIVSKIALVFLVAVFPVLINTMSGVRNLDRQLLRTARCFDATDVQVFRTVALPGSIPFILSGMRLAIGSALIGVFVAELVGAQHGIGEMIVDAGNQFQTARVFAGLIIFAVTGVILAAAVRRAEKHFESWRL